MSWCFSRAFGNPAVLEHPPATHSWDREKENWVLGSTAAGVLGPGAATRGSSRDGDEHSRDVPGSLLDSAQSSKLHTSASGCSWPASPTHNRGRVCSALSRGGSQGEATPQKCSAPHFHPMVSTLARKKLSSGVGGVGPEEAKQAGQGSGREERGQVSIPGSALCL